MPWSPILSSKVNHGPKIKYLLPALIWSRVKIFECVLVAQSCLTLCDPIYYSQPGSSVHGIFYARILEWIAIPFSKGSSQLRDRTRVSCIAGRHFKLWATREARPKSILKTFLAVQELRLYAPSAGSTGSIPGWGSKILHTAQCSLKINK